jgi:hypothetical protein
LAENPVLTDAPSQNAASTATEQKRPNAINPSPAEILPTRILRVETPCLRPKTPIPVPRGGRSPDCAFPRDSLEVLVLARPSDREDGTI